MRISLLCVVLSAFAISLQAQEVTLQRHNGQYGGHHSRAQIEESVVFEPNGPCRVLELRMFMDGNQAGLDTVWIVGDPSEGAIPPTLFVHSYNSLVGPFLIDYQGTPATYVIDLREFNLHLDGYERFIAQHYVKQNGPWFGVDNNQVAGPRAGSFVYDPTTNNNLGFPGVYALAAGDYIVELVVEYDNPEGQGSADPPASTLTDVAREAGLVLPDDADLRSARVSVADFNNDGWDDLTFGSRIFRNNQDGTFANVSDELNITASAVVWADYDNDGDLDAYGARGGQNEDFLYRNDGGVFTDVLSASGISNEAPTVTPIFFDMDNDGDLDLYIANGRRTNENNQEVYYQDRLWRNEGDGTFVNVTESAGIASGEPSGVDCWGATACDFNNDGWTDIFVANYRLEPDFLYRNNADGTFTEVAREYGLHGLPTADSRYFGHGIGCEWADYNNDGAVDLFVGNLGHPDWRGQVSNPSLLYRSSGGPNPTFEEVHQEAGIKFFELNAGVLTLDLDLDGNQDLFHCQLAYVNSGEGGEPMRYSRMYLNSGAPDYTFDDQTWELGCLVHGAWTAARIDYDNDGDMDIIAASARNDGVKLFRNDVEKHGNWLKLRLQGSPENAVNSGAYGTRVVVRSGDKQWYRDLQGAGTGATATQNSSDIHFGLGETEFIDGVEITYSNGARRTLDNVDVNSSIVVPYDETSVSVADIAAANAEWDITGLRRNGNEITFRLNSDAMLPRLTVECVDMSGRPILRRELNNALAGEHSLVLSERPARGVYFLRFSTATGTQSARLIIE